MDETRRQKRASSYARVYLTAEQKYGYLRDLSEDGCGMSFLEPPTLRLGDEVDVLIVPNHDIDLPRVPAVLLVRWLHAEGPSYFVGGALFRIPEEHTDAWRRLVAFFRERP